MAPSRGVQQWVTTTYYLESALRAVFLLLHLLADRLFDLLAVHPRDRDGDDNRDVFRDMFIIFISFIQYTGKKFK